MPPDRTLSNAPRKGVKASKIRLTFMFAVNATGSDRRPPLIIGKANRPRCFGRKSGEELGFFYRSNKTAWMTTFIYQEWIRKWDAELDRERRNILLLHDNF